MTHTVTLTLTLFAEDKLDNSPAYRRGSIPIGKLELIRSADFDLDPDDLTDPHLTIRWWFFTPYPDLAPHLTEDSISEAFTWTMSTHGSCSHDYDCCGCRSFYTRAFLLPDNTEFPIGERTQVWMTYTGSARNY